MLGRAVYAVDHFKFFAVRFLNDEFSGREDDRLKEQLHALIGSYFSVDIATLL